MSFLKTPSKTLLMISMMICMATAGNIIPDSQNPLQMNMPTNYLTGQSLILRFSFPTGSAGLNYKQYIGVAFPASLASDLNFSNNPSNFGCALSDGTTNYAVSAAYSTTSPIHSLAAENHIAYCRIDEMTNVPLKAGVTYTLTLSLSIKIPSTQFVSQIGLFTSTSNNAEKIILDSCPVFGTLGQYSDWEAYRSKPLLITNLDAPIVTTGPSSANGAPTIYPYNTFDLSFSIKSTTFISVNDVYIVLRYPNNLVSGPQSISSVAQLDYSPLKAALKGTLTLSAFSTDSVLISGLEEDLVPEREFRIVFRGWKALDNYTSNAYTIDRALKLYVYYKNTYSVFSVSTYTNLQISQANILFSYIAHPEKWDIWRNGAWPMRFVFTPNTDLVNGGYILIQHVNAKDLTNKLSFIASTCDFSENDSSFDNTFGQRPNCFPLNLSHDFDYKSSSTDYAGSGFFFYVKNLLSAKNYYVTIWLFADNCGGNSQANFNVVGNNSGSSVTFNFQVTLYKSINVTKLNEKRFNSTNVVLAQSAATGMTTGKCYNALVGGAGFSAATFAVDTTNPMEFSTAVLNTNFLALTQTPPTTLSGAIDVALFKEIYDWAASSQTNATTATGYAADVVAGKWTEAFLYGSSNTITSGSYFLVKGTIPASAANPASGTGVAQFFAFPMTYIDGTAKFYYAKSVFLFTSTWFSQGDLTNSSTGCYVSWTFHNSAGAGTSPDARIPKTQAWTTGGATTPWTKVVFDASRFPNVAGDYVGTATKYSEYQPNFITSVWATAANMIITPANTSAAVTLNANDSTLNTPGPYKIVSAQMGVYTTTTTAADTYAASATNTVTTTWLPIDIKNIKTATTAGTLIYPVLFTSCLKWKTTPPTIKSIYSYIDIQWNYSYGDVTNRVNRFIKLYPEGGVFHDYTTKFDTARLGTTNPLYIHYAYANSSTTGVCLMELDAGVLNTLGDTNANTLTLWIFGGSLIETDYSDASATYPAAPLVDNISAYGLSSATAVSKENLYYQDSTYVQHSYIFGSATTPTSGIFDQYVNLVSSKTITTKTFYHLFMGSVLLLTGVTNSNITTTDTTNIPPLLFPFYCPVAKDSNNIRNSYWSEKLPVVIGAWMSISSHDSVGNVNKYIGYSQKNTVTLTDAAQVNRMILNRTSKPATDCTAATPIITIKQNDGITVPSGTRLVNVTLRFNQYTKTATGNDNVLYLFNSTLNNTNNAAQHCTGHVLLINKAITIDSTVTLNFNDITNIKTGTFGYGNSPKTFYALGKPFHRAVLSGTNATYNYLKTGAIGATTETNNFLQSSNTSGITKYYWTGIKRPTVDTFKTFNTNDYLAYFCTSIAVDLNTMVTNFIRASNVFILDYNVDTGASWKSPSIGFDKGEQVIKGDIASNVKLSLIPPVNIPTGAQLTFSANTNAFTANTICGIVLSSGTIVRECTNSNQIITCTANGGTSFNICCYNVAISDLFSLASLSAVFPIYTTTNLTNYISTTIYNASTQIGGANNPFSFITNANSSSNPYYSNTNFSATVLNVDYSQIFQEGGYGKAIITISLPREPVRDGKIIFSGDFSNMLIPGNIPRCIASFTSKLGASWDSADALIDTCSTYSFSKSSNPIVITTKKMVYKCGLTFTKILTVQLWPVVVVNWAASTSNAYKVLLQLNSGDNIANNAAGFNMPTVLGLDPKPMALGQADTLCTVSSINPRIPGAYADYVFDFDLDTNKFALANQAAPNEVTIFWPYAYYGSSQNVMCYYKQNLTNCSFTDEGILNIKFAQVLPIGSGKKISVTVNSVLNPSIDGDYSFPCTVNSTNFSTQKRLNLITGSGKLSAGINLSTVIATGALRLMQASAKISDVNPRSTSTHTFRVTIDRGTDLTTSPLTIANSPYIMITFPKEYNLAWYPSVKPTASIDPYTNDANNNIVKGNTIAPSNVIQSGNRVFIYLPDISYTLDNTWRYWEIKVTNIVGPTDNTAQKVSQSTSAYDVLITNSNLTSLYKTYTNLNQGSFDPLVPAVDAWFAYNRGNTFTFDNTKWIIDIATDGVLNMLNIKPGRYYTSSFLIRSNSSSTIQPSAVVMSLVDATFKTLDASYTVSSSYMQSIPFHIGVACGTAPGNYIVYFNYILTTAAPANWAPLSPIQISIDNVSKGTISYQTPSPIPAAGSTWIGIVLSEPNFDALTVTWVDADNVKNDPSAKLESVSIPANTLTGPANGSSNNILSPIRCTFSITNFNINTPQIYKTSDPNSCYTWVSNIITINIQYTSAIIPQDYDIVPAFTFYNATNDSTLAPKNSIRFSVNLPYAPIYIYCALVCINNDFPATEDIKAPTIQNTNILQFYSGVYTSTTGHNILFNNLIRGQKYKLKCIIESVEGDKTKRTSNSGTLNQYTNADGILIDIMPSYPQTTYCAQFLFYSEPSQETKIAIIQYCQKLFSTPGWVNNGCVVCTDSGLSYITPGLNLPDENICVAPKTTTLRFLDTVDSTNGTTSTSSTPATTTDDLVIPVATVENNGFLYSVCAIASTVCNTDISGKKLYTDYFNQFKNDLATQDLFKKTLNIIDAQVAQVNIYDDTKAPDLAALSISNMSNQLTGLVTFTATNATPLKCSYQITTAAASAAPSFDSILSCTDALCGTVKPNLLGSTVSTNANNLKALTPSTTYNIFFACTNDIPYTQKRATVLSVGTFTTVSSNDTSPQNTSTANINSTDSTPNNTDSIPNNTESTPNNTDSTPNSTDSIPNNTESIPNNTDSTPNNTDSIPNNTDSIPNNTDSIPNNTDSTPNSTESTLNNTDSIPNSTESIPNNTDSIPNSTESIPNSTESIPNSTESTLNNTESTPNNTGVFHYSFATMMKLSAIILKIILFKN
jgi:hypothetical protein